MDFTAASYHATRSLSENPTPGEYPNFKDSDSFFDRPPPSPQATLSVGIVSTRKYRRQKLKNSYFLSILFLLLSKESFYFVRHLVVDTSSTIESKMQTQRH